MTDAAHALQTADRVIALGCQAWCKPGALYLETDSPAEVERWAAAHILDRNTKVLLLIGTDVDVERATQTIRALEEREAHAVIDQNTIEKKTESIGRSYVQNLARLARDPWTAEVGWATDTLRPLRGLPAFIVGAGPSLERNRHLLGDAHNKGAVFAVNTSANAVETPLDAVFCVESLDVSSGLTRKSGHNPLHVLDMAANPVNWEVPAGARTVIAGSDAAMMPYTLEAGGLPLPFSAGVTSAAMSLAWYLGADPIVLVGQDLANSPEGQCYASGTPFEDLETKVVDGVVEQTAGDSKKLHPTPTLEVDGWGGTRVQTTYNWKGFIDWWGSVAQHQPGRLINATEGGARIHGAVELPLSAVLAGLDDADRGGMMLPPEQQGAARYPNAVHMLRFEAQSMLDASDEAIHAARMNCPLSNMWIAPAVSRMNREGGLAPHERAERIMEIYRTAAAEILEVVDG